jgi:alkenylglycerophosphocholine/alkenylglycerophosphoethanolamine hydrolase
VSGASWGFLVLTAVFAVADWYAVANDRRTLEYAAKPATMVALAGVALTLDPADSTARVWFVVAIGFSLLGDVLLMLPRNLFVGGLAAFLLGHIAYVAGLLSIGVTAVGLAVGAVLVTAAVTTIGLRIVRAVRESDEADLAAPVLAYIVVISLMVACAVGTGEPLAIVGSVLFYSSDALIAWNRFVESYPWGRVAIMVTYHLGQVGLVLSLAS